MWARNLGSKLHINIPRDPLGVVVFIEYIVLKKMVDLTKNYHTKKY